MCGLGRRCAAIDKLPGLDSTEQPVAMPDLTAVITCPHCGLKSTETMPTDACLYVYVCAGCQEELRPRKGDCCVFCSYSDRLCPPRQAA
jgi:hypothetical protein